MAFSTVRQIAQVKVASFVSGGRLGIITMIKDYLKRKNAQAATCDHVFNRPHDLERQFGKMCSKCGIAEKGFHGKGPLTIASK